MVIGNGLVAKSFSEFNLDDRYLIFASGVSNSKETLDSEFLREFNLIKENINTEKKFIYFSTINNGDNQYFKHKRFIENFICSNSNNYLIFKLPNVVGNGGNTNNFFNYFKNKILNHHIIEIQDVYRSLVDIDDVLEICKYCLSIKNKIINISNIEKLKVDDVVDIMSTELKTPSIKKIVGDGVESDIDNSIEVEIALGKLSIIREGYIKRIIKKYLKNG